MCGLSSSASCSWDDIKLSWKVEDNETNHPNIKNRVGYYPIMGSNSMLFSPLSSCLVNFSPCMSNVTLPQPLCLAVLESAASATNPVIALVLPQAAQLNTSKRNETCSEGKYRPRPPFYPNSNRTGLGWVELSLTTYWSVQHSFTKDLAKGKNI